MGLSTKYSKYFSSIAAVAMISSAPFAHAKDDGTPDKIDLVKARERIEEVLSKEPYNSQKLYSSLSNLSGLIERMYGQCGNNHACKDNLTAEQGWYKDYIEILLGENDLTLSTVAPELFGSSGPLMVAFSMVTNCEDCKDPPVIQDVGDMALYCIDKPEGNPEMDIKCNAVGRALEQL